jgi:hypothetical protein
VQTVATKTSQKHAGWQIRGKQLGVISGERNLRIQQQISDAGIFGSACVSDVMIGTMSPT